MTNKTTQDYPAETFTLLYTREAEALQSLMSAIKDLARLRALQEVDGKVEDEESLKEATEHLAKCQDEAIEASQKSVQLEIVMDDAQGVTGRHRAAG